MNANVGVVCAQFESALINSSGICFVCFVVTPPPPGSRRFCCRGFDLRFGVDKFFARRANSDRLFYRLTQPGLRPEPKNSVDHETHETHEREVPRMNADGRESRRGLRTN